MVRGAHPPSGVWACPVILFAEQQGDRGRNVTSVIICGRDLSAALLQRLRDEAAGLSLRALGRWLCEALGLVGPGGRPQVAVAIQMLRTLIGQGILSLVGRAAPSRCRTPGPVLPEPETPRTASLTCSLEELGPI